jgi:hypothetical protein
LRAVHIGRDQHEDDRGGSHILFGGHTPEHVVD